MGRRRLAAGCARSLHPHPGAGTAFRGMPQSGSANHAYCVWVDRYDTLGLGKNVPIFNTNGSESLMAVVSGKVVDIPVIRIYEVRPK